MTDRLLRIALAVVTPIVTLFFIIVGFTLVFSRKLGRSTAPPRPFATLV